MYFKAVLFKGSMWEFFMGVWEKNNGQQNIGEFNKTTLGIN